MKEPDKKEYILSDPIYVISRKCKQIYSDRNHISDILGMGGGGWNGMDRLQRSRRTLLGVVDCGHGFMGEYICQNI